MSELTLPLRIEMPQIKILIPNEEVLVRLHKIWVQKPLGKPPAPGLKFKNPNLENRRPKPEVTKRSYKSEPLHKGPYIREDYIDVCITY